MSSMKEILVRVPEEMIARVDAYAAEVGMKVGMKPNRSDLVRSALGQFLDRMAKRPNVAADPFAE